MSIRLCWRRLFLGWAMIGAGALSSLSAATRTWDGGGGTYSWGTVANWVDDQPLASGDSIVLDGVGVITTNTYSTGTVFKGITFNSSAGSFTLTGNSITLSGAVVNNSTNTQTVSLGIVLSGKQSITASTGTIVMSGAIDGSYGLDKDGDGTVILKGTNGYTGLTSVNRGKLLINGSNLGSSRTFVGNGGTLGGTGVTGGVTVSAGGTLSPGDGVGVGKFSIAGGLNLNADSLTAMKINGLSLGTGYDSVSVASSLIYGGSLQLAIGCVFAPGDYTVALFTDFLSQSGDFQSIQLSGQYNLALQSDGMGTWSRAWIDGLTTTTFTFSLETGALEISSVPEPATGWIVVAGMGLLFMAKTRRLRIRKRPPVSPL